jgi:hypothetical protein
MNGDVHVRFWEGPAVQFRGPTRPSSCLEAAGLLIQTTISDARTIDQETGPINVVMTIASSLHPLLKKKGHR